MISDRADSRGEGDEGWRRGRRKGTKGVRVKGRQGGGGKGGIEERNQRRLSAYEVGIVGRRRFARSLRIARRWAPSLPAVQKRSIPRQMFFLNGDELEPINNDRSIVPATS